MARVAPVPAEVIDQFSNHLWRLNNLYWITDKEGRRTKFKLNWAQEKLVRDMHYLNLILKARQLGFTTFIQIYMLDAAVFFRDTRCGVIAHTRDDAEAIFRDKIKFPYDNLPEQIRGANPIVKNNTTTLELANNSSIRVGTSLRGGTLQYLHVSEFGKVCAKYPEKAREIITGALNTIDAGQVAFIESTAEGQEGRFYEMCQSAQSAQRRGDKLSPMDWKFFFFPWWKHPGYRIPADDVPIADGYRTYFEELEARHGIKLDAEQRAWYAKKAKNQGSDMKREFPSTPEEAFEASVEGAYYADQMAKAELEGRIGKFPPHRGLKVHTVWDIGVGDYTTIWFFQVTPSRVRLVGYYHNSGEGIPHYLHHLVDRAERMGWTYGDHWLPHDARVKEWGTGRTRVEQFKDGILLADGTRFKPSAPRIVPAHSVDDGINALRSMLGIAEIDAEECAEGVKALNSYRKEWDEEHGVWKDRPRHDWASHGADGGRYLAMAYREVTGPNLAPPPGPKLIQNATFSDVMPKLGASKGRTRI